MPRVEDLNVLAWYSLVSQASVTLSEKKAPQEMADHEDHGL